MKGIPFFERRRRLASFVRHVREEHHRMVQEGTYPYDLDTYLAEKILGLVDLPHNDVIILATPEEKKSK